MQLSGALLIAGFATSGFAATIAAAAKPTVYLIRHGEKPPNDGVGLSAEGVQRSQCLRSVFGAASKYNIGYILAQTPKDSELYLPHCFMFIFRRQNNASALTKAFY